MLEGLRQEIQYLLMLAAALLIIGAVNGYMAETIVVGGLLYTGFTLGKIHRLYAWLASDKSAMPPEMSGVWGDISDELYRLKQRLEQSKKNYTALALRIRQITSAIDDGLLLLNADRSLDWWNPGATQLLHLQADDKGENIGNLIRNPRFVRFVNSDTFSEPLELPSPGNHNHILQFSGSTYGRGEIVIMVRDITRLRHLEEMRKEFVANISHELRTPLTVLVGYIETLGDSAHSLPGHWQRALEQMSQQTKRLSALADDLVMLSRLESTPQTTQPEPIDLCSLLKTIVDNLSVLCTPKHRLALHCEPGLQLFGNTTELHSAFSNLVINAIKHNPQGCDIDILAQLDPEGVQVAVCDSGIGIDKKHLPRLTERFYRADDSRSGASGGTGLGLAIVKHVLARHRSQLEISSTLGKGSTFTCRFPIEQVSSEPSASPSA